MNLPFRDAVAAALPSEERLRNKLELLPFTEWTELALVFSASLPEVDAVLAVPGAEGFAEALAASRGIPVLNASSLEGAQAGQDILLVTRDLTDGLNELRMLLQAEHHCLNVRAVASAIERTNDLGRVRLELQRLLVLSAVRLAGTPEGLVFERRVPQSWPQAS
ncbi:hypothetical protein [Deinococcus hopiensis]|uniref:Uncharacterized protein n=1 Tax=Deinococcus hopiensis KR-140 TaxID=695939 RepID=A0A1W1VML5_9DEIO|nr:hypothetical protein [Deinococcus hopiensis]SMB94602.1 hypothetical protein SAMN00790413_02453 [Deinococcus hopiensis KR-140]